MRSRALSDMRTDAYRLMDVENATGRFPPAEVTRYVNQGVAWVWDLLVTVRGFSFYGKPLYATPTITAAGTTPPTVTVDGVPRVGTSTSNFILDVVTGGTLGTMTFRVSNDNGTSYGSTITSASTGIHYLPDIGLTATFAAGTYNANNTYTGSTYARPTTTANVQVYALPSDFLKLHELYLTDGSDESFLPLEPSGLDASAMYREMDAGQPSYYVIRDGFYELLPTPSTAYTIKMVYVPTSPILAADSDTFDGIVGYEDAVAIYAAQQMSIKNREDELTMILMGKLQDWERRIRGSAVSRDQGKPERVQDIRQFRRHMRRWPWARP